LCRHIGLLFGKRLDAVLLRNRIRKYPDSLYTRYRIRCRFIFFRYGERIQKYPDSLPNSPYASGRKPDPERKSCGFKNIPILVDEALVDAVPSISFSEIWNLSQTFQKGCFNNKMNHRNEIFQDSEEVLSKYMGGYQEQWLREHSILTISSLSTLWLLSF